MGAKNRQVVLASRPVGMPRAEDFELVDTEVPEPGEAEFLVRINYLSVDPYMRGLIGPGTSYQDRVGIGEVMPGGTVGTVAASNHPEYQEGEVVAGRWGWQEYAVCDGRDVRKVDPERAPISTALGVLGMTGMTAYFGLLEVGRPRPGDSVFVSGAAGAVGSMVGRLARIAGCRVAGCAGSREKIDYMLDELGYHAAFNYKEEDNYGRAVRHACPDGVDVYFDNVGGPITDGVFRRLNRGARIVVCGQISQYNNTERPEGPRKLWYLITRQARAEGFMVYSFEDRFPEARARIARWIEEGRITYRQTIADGLQSAPQAFIGLFKGENIGKQLVRVHPE